MAEKISVEGISNLKQTMPTRVLKIYSQQETRTENQQRVSQNKHVSGVDITHGLRGTLPSRCVWPARHT